MKKLFRKQNEGFVALFTVLLAAVILSMALGISSIALKQIFLTASATDANKSFYAADSGIECALYHDLRGIPPNSFDISSSNVFTIDCNGQSIDVIHSAQNYFGEFQVPVGSSNEYCAYVTVTKDFVVNSTRVVSRGTNFPCGQTGGRLVERAIEVTY